MAFHPFRSFQKRRKTWLAGLTIMAMITFILSGSSAFMQGDFFGWVSEAFGAKAKYPTVVKLYGKKVDNRDVIQLRQTRMLANEFMRGAKSMAFQNVTKELNDSLGQFGEYKPQIEGLLKQLGQNPFSDTSFIRFMIADIQKKLESAGKNSQARLLGQYLVVLDDRAQMLQQLFDPKRRNELYFGGSVGLEDLLDFLIWKQQADRLGIQLTDQDVKNAVAWETLDALKDENVTAVQGMLSQRYGKVNRETLYAALADEFRVRMAQAALLGYEPGERGYRENKTSPTNQVPAGVTPQEFWDYYCENVIPSKLALLPVPVKEFVNNEEQPAEEKVLRIFFNNNKEQESAPDRERPGFKQPRRVQVEWVSAKADSDLYQNQAKVTLAAAQSLLLAADQLVARSVLPASGGFSTGQLLLPTPYQLVIATEYEQQKYLYALSPALEPFTLAFYTSHARPDDAAALVENAVLSGALGGSPLSPVLSFYHSAAGREADKMKPAVQREAAKRSEVVATLVGAGADLSPWSLAGLCYQAGQKEETLPLAVVQGQLEDRIRLNTASAIVVTSLTTFSNDLRSRRSNPKEAELFVAKAVKERGFNPYGHSEKPRDRYDVADDAGLKPLKDVYVKSMGDTKAERFYELFFRQPGTYDPPTQFLTSLDGEPYVYWKTEDKSAYVPKYEDVRDQVLQAWRLSNARVRAKKAADELATRVQDKARNAKGERFQALQAERDVLAKEHKDVPQVFTLENVARLVPRRVATGEFKKQYDPYKLPEDQITYPRPNFVDKLTALREAGTAVVLSDRPEKTYYVAVLLNRPQPSEAEFYRIYSQTPFQDGLLTRLEEDRRQQYRQQVLRQLRADAGPVDDNGSLVLDLDPDARKGLDVKPTDLEQ